MITLSYELTANQPNVIKPCQSN